jgi:hypothetical protein
MLFKHLTATSSPQIKAAAGSRIRFSATLQKLGPEPQGGIWSIQTLSGYFLTAVGGGGHGNDISETIHTDALNANLWEKFYILRCNELGSGLTYTIEGAENHQGTPAWVSDGFLGAVDGGGHGGTVFWPFPVVYGYTPPFAKIWVLLKQADGTYALQTASGNVVTAQAGGIPDGGFRTDTERDQIGNFEKFQILDNGDFTSHIKTYSGTYLSYGGPDHPHQVNTVWDVGSASLFRFWLLRGL